MSGPPSLEQHPDIDDWLAVAEDGRILVRTGKAEIGQGVSTAIARIAAVELAVALDAVEVLAPSTGDAPDEGYTSGSNSIEHSGGAVRLAAASARERLLGLAAAALGVEAGALDIGDGLVRSRRHNRSLTYRELLPGGRFAAPVDLDAPLRLAPDHRVTGSVGRRVADLVTGRTRFVQDLSRPGMLHARVVRPPHYHARLAALDEAVVARLDGVELVRDGSFLAVVAADEYRAVKAVGRVAAAASWSPGDGLEPMDVYERLTTNPRVSLPVVEGVPHDAPVPPRTAAAGAAATLTARYERPYQMHGSVGPSAALAELTPHGLSVWTHSQGIYPLRDSLAEALALDASMVTVAHVPGAGCYGHNGADDAALDAALVARALPGRPVLLKWTREDEHAWAPYGPAMVVELEASMDARGHVVDWSHESHSDSHRGRPRAGANGAGPARLLATRFLADPVPPYVPGPTMDRHAGIHRNADPIYAFPHRRVVKHLVRDMPLRASALRTLGGFANVLAIECFIDELAAAAGVDPHEFRLRHLEDARGREVLGALAERCGWSRPLPAGVGRGLGFARYKNEKAYAGVAVELEVDAAARVRLQRAVIVADAGRVIDPPGLRAQLEGGFLQAASWTLLEEVTFDRGGITSRDWDSYPILRFTDVPEVDVLMLERPGEPPLGAGEAACGPAGAAIVNAVHAATGLRLRRLPLTPDAIRAAALA